MTSRLGDLIREIPTGYAAWGEDDNYIGGFADAREEAAQLADQDDERRRLEMQASALLMDKLIEHVGTWGPRTDPFLDDMKAVRRALG